MARAPGLCSYKAPSDIIGPSGEARVGRAVAVCPVYIPRTVADGSPGQDAWNSEDAAELDEDAAAELNTALVNIPGIGDVTSTLQPPGYESDEQ
eukprot:COSAG05_NODE_91_length_19902_cov_59.347523_1_plen_94_part_00